MNSGTHGGADARKKSRLNPAATDSDKPGGEGRREEGGSRLIVPRRSYLKVFFFSLLIPFIQLPEDLLYECTRARNEPIAAGFVQKQPISRARKCLMGVSSGTFPVLLDFCPSRPESPKTSVVLLFCFFTEDFNKKET